MKTITQILGLMVVFAFAGVGLFTSCGPGEALAHVSTPSGWHTFTDGQPLTATQLNNNFAHLHSTLTGAIANANISTTAAIAHSKLAAPVLVPKVMGGGTGTCSQADGDPCTLMAGSYGISSITGAGNGQYNVQLSSPLPSLSYFVFVTVNNNQSNLPNVYCFGYPGTVSNVRVMCKHRDAADDGTFPSAGFSVLVFSQ